MRYLVFSILLMTVSAQAQVCQTCYNQAKAEDQVLIDNLNRDSNNYYALWSSAKSNLDACNTSLQSCQNGAPLSVSNATYQQCLSALTVTSNDAATAKQNADILTINNTRCVGELNLNKFVNSYNVKLIAKLRKACGSRCRGVK